MVNKTLNKAVVLGGYVGGGRLTIHNSTFHQISSTNSKVDPLRSL